MIKRFLMIFLCVSFVVVWFGLADNMIAAYLIETRFPNEVNPLGRACNGNASCGFVGLVMNIAAFAVGIMVIFHD